MSYLLAAGSAIAIFLLGYGVRALRSRRRRRRWSQRRSAHRLFSQIGPNTDDRVLSKAVDAFRRTRESGALDPAIAYLGQASALLALGRDSDAEVAFASAMESGPAALVKLIPGPAPNSSSAPSPTVSDLERFFVHGLDRARRSGSGS